MRAKVDPSARVEATAIGSNVTIGPYCTVGPHVTLGEGCRLVAHVNLTGHTSVGPRTVIQPFASLGSPPQSVHYRGGPTRLVVGADCDIRENVTMSVGTEDGGGVTEVGDRCFLWWDSMSGMTARSAATSYLPTTFCWEVMSLSATMRILAAASRSANSCASAKVR